jgi:hypothetical protein
MRELLTQAKGRPAQESADDDHVTVFYNVITTCDHGEHDQLVHNGVRIEEPEEAARLIAEATAG